MLTDDVAPVKTSIERAVLAHAADCTAPFAEAEAYGALVRFAAREVARGEPAQRAPQYSRSPALWAAMGALAGAEFTWALPRMFGA